MVFHMVIPLICVALNGLMIMSVSIVSLIYKEQKAKTHGYGLVKIAGELDPVIGRDKEIQSLVTILSGKTMNNPVLIGEPGVGKTAVVRGLAQRIVGKQVPGNLRNVKLITLDIGALVTGTKFRGQFEKWLKEVEGARGRIILFIEDIHLVLGGGCIDASNLFKAMLARGRVRCIGTTTPEGYRKYIAAFEGRIQPVFLYEPSVADTCSILHGLKAKYEDYHGVRILDRALASAAQLSSRYITWRRLPDKAIDLVDEACAKIKVKLNSHHQEPVGPEQIAEVVSRWTGIRVINLGQNEKEQLLGLVDKLHKRIVGQDEAVQAVAEAVLRLGAGFGKSQKPAGSFLFLGPTGVGKTELAKALAAELFDHEDHLIRIDMSEYMVLHSVSKLIGAPPGSSGHEEVGQLTEAVRQRPYSVVLFDEVEKAHESVLNILLQVLDGRLTDGQGRTVSFSNTIIIMTSNLGTEPLLAALSGHTTIKTAREKVMQEVRSHFRPEMLNRIDKIQMFDLISGDELKKVAKLQIKDLEIRLGQRGAMQLKVTDAALDFILDNAGYDPVYVAELTVAESIKILRDLKRAFEDGHSVKIVDGALASAAQLSSRNIIGRRLPDKAIDVVEEACTKVEVKLSDHRQEIHNLERKRKSQLQALETEKDEASKARLNQGLQETEAEINKHKDVIRELTEPVGAERIAEVVSRWNGICFKSLCQNETEGLKDLVGRLHGKIVGQDEAVQPVADAVLRWCAGFGRPRKPIGSFLFVGPTGVGKTELAKALAAELFADESQLVRIDMSEYMDQQSVSRLIGAHPGCVDYEKGGLLTEAVRGRPCSVVLFDEVEKAHNSVLNTLLPMLDDGRLRDRQGRTISFSNTIIIMTSNLGADPLLAALSGHTTVETARENVMQEVRRCFGPQLLSRLDEIVTFNFLRLAELKTVAKLQMKDLEIRLRQKGAMQLKVTDAALDFILDNAGYDPVYGARSLLRWLDRNVVTKLSSMLINREIDDSAVYIDAIPGRQTLSYCVRTIST